MNAIDAPLGTDAAAALPWNYPVIEHGSKIGIHGILGGPPKVFVQDLANRGLHFGVVKAVDDLGWLLDVKQMAPETITLARLTSEWESVPDLVNPGTDLDMLADHIMEPIAAKLAQHPEYANGIDYWEVVNEPDPPGPEGYRLLAEVMKRCMTRAAAMGIHIAIFGLNAGTPEWDEIQAVVETGVFGDARRGGHIFTVHEGILPDPSEPIETCFDGTIPGSPFVDGAGCLNFRHRFFYALLEPRHEEVPVVVSEFYIGPGYEADSASPEVLRDRLAWYDAESAHRYYEWSVQPFTLGGQNVGWDHQDYGYAYPAFLDYMDSVRDRVNQAHP